MVTRRLDFARQQTDFEKGLAFQRERYKAAMDGTGPNNFDLMKDALTCMKVDLKHKAKKNNLEKNIIFVEKVLKFYAEKEIKFSKNTPEGVRVVFPYDYHIKMENLLNLAYEKLIEIQEELGML